MVVWALKRLSWRLDFMCDSPADSLSELKISGFRPNHTKTEQKQTKTVVLRYVIAIISTIALDLWDPGDS